MRRVVCDVGVVISGLLSAGGPPGRLLDHWRDGRFDLIVSPLWLAESARVLERRKIARYSSRATPPSWSLQSVSRLSWSMTRRRRRG